MKKLIAVALLAVLSTGCSSSSIGHMLDGEVKSSLEAMPHYEETPEHIKVQQTYQHAVTAQMVI